MAFLMVKCDMNEYNYGLYHGIRKKFVIWNERKHSYIKKERKYCSYVKLFVIKNKKRCFCVTVR